jgi:hypothetical protein
VTIALLLLVNASAWATFGFANPAAINTNAVIDTGDDEFSRIATDGAGNWVAVWDSTDTLGDTIGADYDILVSYSTNNGATWSPVQALNTNADTDSGADFSPALATDAAGHWVVVWFSVDTLGGTIGSDRDILVSRSSDGGATWTDPAPLNTDADTDTSVDEYPTLGTDGNGTWIAVWDSDGGPGGKDAEYNMLFSRSTDNGMTWSSPAAVDSGAGTNDGLDGFAKLAANGDGDWVMVWQSAATLGTTIGADSDILVSRSSNDGVSWSIPEPLNTNAATDSGDDDSATIATDGAGNWVSAWSSSDSLGGTIGTDTDILVSRSTDNGDTWTAPAPLNNATNGAADGLPWIATDGAGTWLTVWQSGDTLGGTVGFDQDIFIARSTDNGATWSTTDTLYPSVATDLGNDYYPIIAYGGAGFWMTVWYSDDSLGGTIGSDRDILFTTSGGVAGGALTILVPNGGERWKQGTTKQIEWESSGVQGQVKLELLKNGGVVQTIENKTKNDGKHKWKVPNSLAPGNGYKVRVTSKADTGVSDESDGSFRIKAAK